MHLIFFFTGKYHIMVPVHLEEPSLSIYMQMCVLTFGHPGVTRSNLIVSHEVNGSVVPSHYTTHMPNHVPLSGL